MPTTPDPVAVLAAALRRHEPALRAIPGVTGCGIGMAADDSGRPVIQVFVGTAGRADGVTAEVADVLGSCAFEMVVMSPPSADVRRLQAPDRTREDP
jgi:hypothetical protein